MTAASSPPAPLEIEVALGSVSILTPALGLNSGTCTLATISATCNSFTPAKTGKEGGSSISGEGYPNDLTKREEQFDIMMGPLFAVAWVPHDQRHEDSVPPVKASTGVGDLHVRGCRLAWAEECC